MTTLKDLKAELELDILKKSDLVQFIAGWYNRKRIHGQFQWILSNNS